MIGVSSWSETILRMVDNVHPMKSGKARVVVLRRPEPFPAVNAGRRFRRGKVILDLLFRRAGRLKECRCERSDFLRIIQHFSRVFGLSETP
ncbi:hypothetical protein [Sagittula sp.]|uniref:hypothetical protein n=1 Tax=Sagittula sp. TaxID=2038081 RepID=UPI003559E612